MYKLVLNGQLNLLCGFMETNLIRQTFSEKHGEG